jgi:hypothetical protein
VIGLVIGYVFYRIKTQKSSIVEFHGYGGTQERATEELGNQEITASGTMAAPMKDPVNTEEVPVGATLRRDTDYGRVSGRLALGDEITVDNRGSTNI